jgi:hypothetical protein
MGVKALGEHVIVGIVSSKGMGGQAERTTVAEEVGDNIEQPFYVLAC